MKRTDDEARRRSRRRYGGRAGGDRIRSPSSVAIPVSKEGLFIADNPDDLVSRPPVVTIARPMGHGKTSLLDAIRHAKVIGRSRRRTTYQLLLSGGEDGQEDHLHRHSRPRGLHRHACRGARATDIAILVVAADDDNLMMPQTIRVDQCVPRLPAFRSSWPD